MALNLGNLGINELTTGIDAQGMENYIEDLKVSIITQTKEKIDNVEAINAAINSGWQGVAKERFYNDFEETRNIVKDDLDKEYTNLLNRLSELQSQYFQADMNRSDKNGQLLDKSVNRSTGRQISYLIRDLKEDTLSRNFRMVFKIGQGG